MIKTISQIWNESKNNHKSIILALVFSFLRSVFAITQIIAIMITLDVLTGVKNVNSGITIIIILTIICIIGNFITSYFEQINALKSGLLMAKDKRLEIADKLRKVPLGFFNNQSRSSTISTLTTTLGGIENAATMVIVNVIAGLFNSISFLIFMLIFEWKIGLIMFLGMVIYLIVVNYQMKASRINAPLLKKAQTELSNETLSFIQGIKVIKSYDYKDSDKLLKEKIASSRKENIDLTVKSMPTQYLTGFIIALFESVMLVLTLVLYLKVKSIDLYKTIILIIFSFMAYASLNQAGSILAMIGLLETGLDEVEVLNKTKELDNKLNKEEIKSNEIELKNVCFKYDTNEVLHNVSFKVLENNLTAIVGPSGSGKSTICELIPRFYDIEQGEILLGGKNIKDIDYDILSSKISMVFQRVYLFSDTILNNIRFSKPDASMEEVIEASKKARCHDFIMKLPNGYDTILTEGGNNLSGGEKERISIARAILKDSPIIILDEATASVDPENELEITKAIEELTKNKTVLMIAHKLKTIKNAKSIIVLEKGEVKETGTHEELIKNNGLYKKFIDSLIKAKNFTITK